MRLAFIGDRTSAPAESVFPCRNHFAEHVLYPLSRSQSQIPQLRDVGNKPFWFRGPQVSLVIVVHPLLSREIVKLEDQIAELFNCPTYTCSDNAHVQAFVDQCMHYSNVLSRTAPVPDPGLVAELKSFAGTDDPLSDPGDETSDLLREEPLPSPRGFVIEDYSTGDSRSVTLPMDDTGVERRLLADAVIRDRPHRRSLVLRWWLVSELFRRTGDIKLGARAVQAYRFAKVEYGQSIRSEEHVGVLPRGSHERLSGKVVNLVRLLGHHR